METHEAIAGVEAEASVTSHIRDAEKLAIAAGAIIERDARGVRVSMPPLRGSAILAPWQWTVLAIIGFRGWMSWGETQSLPQLDSFVFAALIIYVLLTCWRRRIIIVNNTEVAMGYSARGGLFWAKRWPLRAIGEIKVNPENGNLLIRVTGVDRRDFRISPDRVVSQAVADILEAALVQRSHANDKPNADQQ